MEKTPLKINKEVKTLKLNVTNIRSILIQENKRKEKLKKEKKSDEMKKKSFAKLKNKEKILENAKKIPVPVVGKVGSNIKNIGQNIIDKILNFGGLILAGILVNNLPKIIETVRGIIDSIVNFLTPIQSGFNLIKGIFTGEIDKTKYDADKKRFDDSLSQLTKDGGLIDQIAEKAGPLEGLIKLLKPAIELFRNVAGGKDKVLAVKDGQEGVKNNTTGEFTPRQFTQAERDRYTGAGGRGAGDKDRRRNNGGGGRTSMSMDAADIEADTPEEKAFIATVRELEGTAGTQGYNTWFGGRTDMDLSQMTVNEVVAEQKRRLSAGEASYSGYTSAAVGAGQFMKPEQTVMAMGLDPSKVKYTSELQNKMILFQSQKYRGVDPSKKLTENDMKILGGEWASFTPQLGQTSRTAVESLRVYDENLEEAKAITPDPSGGPLTLDSSEIPGENATPEEMDEYERKLAEIAKRQAAVLKEKEKQERILFENWIDNSNKKSKKGKEISIINQPMDDDEEEKEVLVAFQRIYNTKTIPFPTYIPV